MYKKLFLSFSIVIAGVQYASETPIKNALLSSTSSPSDVRFASTGVSPLSDEHSKSQRSSAERSPLHETTDAEAMFCAQQALYIEAMKKAQDAARDAMLDAALEEIQQSPKASTVDPRNAQLNAILTAVFITLNSPETVRFLQAIEREAASTNKRI